jgi:cysteine desulfurase
MIPYFTHKFGNANSQHFYGNESLIALSHSREKVAEILNSDFEEVVFTSGATESNRMVLTNCGEEKRVVSLKTEHKSVVDICSNMKEGLLLDVETNGKLNIELLKETLQEGNISLVSICFVNNETGVTQDIKKIADVCHEHGVLIHTDATQAFGKLKIDVKDLGVDFLSASGHKIYGPKGVGILYYNKKHHKKLRIRLANHAVEFGIRAGTSAIPLCIGLAKAASILADEMDENIIRIAGLRNHLIETIQNSIEETYVNGANDDNYPGIVNISFRGCEGEAIMMEASQICVSSGSACTSNKLTISHVLDAMKVPSDTAQSSIRVSIGKHTSRNDIEIAAEDLIKATNKLRDMSSVWEMIKRGDDIEEVFKDASCMRH